ncbi:MAG: carbamoyltransferase [Pirellulaceae bacterium]
MTAILGISAFYHDSAAALIVDGKIVAAAQEERFTRKKHDPSFPEHAIDFCLEASGITPNQLDLVAFYEKPLLKFDRLLETYLAFAPQGWASFCQAMPTWLREKLFLDRQIRKGLQNGYRRRIVYAEHHESHAASAFFPSPFEQAAILTCDGVGEWTTTSFGVGSGNTISLTHELRFPHSLGLLYSAFTYYCGFKVNSGEYKLMGLAPYGEPRFADTIRQHLIDIKPDGSFQLDLSYFNYCQGLTMTSNKFHRLFGRKPRSPESAITPLDMDLAASIQLVTEQILLAMANHVHAETGQRNLCLAGGVSLNCVANGRLLREGPFEKIWVQPAAGDAGGALGVALLTWYQLLKNEREVDALDSQRGSFLGPQFSPDECAQFLEAKDAVFRQFKDEAELCDFVAKQLNDQKIVGWFQGAAEFGPRALGARSILGDARNPDMQRSMNLKTKFRESFRPFAPAVLRDHAADVFEVRDNLDSPYMLFVAPVAKNRRHEIESASGAPGLERRNEVRSDVPAITHVDYSARLQTIDPARHGSFYRLVQRFHALTGCPLVVNTSFNVRGEPIVGSIDDAFRCFLATNIDCLVLENCVVLKSEQRNPITVDAAAYLNQFELD